MVRQNVRAHVCVCVPGGPALVGTPDITTHGSSRGVVTRGRQDRPYLDNPSFDGPLDDPCGADSKDDPGPDPLRGPQAAGTSIAGFSTPNCTNSTNVRPNPPQERRVRHEKAVPWSDLGGVWSNLHISTWILRESKPRRLSAARDGGLVPDRPSNRHRMGPRIVHPVGTGCVSRIGKSAPVLQSIGPGALESRDSARTWPRVGRNRARVGRLRANEIWSCPTLVWSKLLKFGANVS